jgi:tetratricopeptide (TPR) repeat protein
LLALGPAADLPMATVRAQMYYYFACHWESQGDAKQQRENIEKAAKESPKDVNALIGFYRLPDLKPEEKQKVVQTIEQVSEELRESIRNNQRSPDNPRETVAASTKEGYDCNQFAWLIANTVGDLDEALKYSKRSVELQPTSGGLYDTLAHVYYAKGDYESAVSTQKKALELEPHSGLIKKKLDVFEKALAEKKK